MNNEYTLEIWEEDHILYIRCTADGIDYWVGNEPSDKAVFKGFMGVEPKFGSA